MQFVSNIPIYIQVADDLKAKIITGEIKPGDKLPSNRELAFKYKINPNTVQRVYREMEFENLCYTKRGIGIFVTENELVCQKLREESIEKMTEKMLTKLKELNVEKKEIIDLIEKIWRRI